MITEVSQKSSTKGNAMLRKATVQVVDDRWLVFEPTTNIKHTGFIIYPGGRLDPISYGPTAKQLSTSEYLVVLVQMPLTLSVFGAERAGDVMEAYPEIENWAIAGHSVGGNMAPDLHTTTKGKCKV